MRRLLPMIVLLFSTTAFAQLRGPTNQILISAAGSAQGANGTFFHSDVTITNYRDVSQIVSLQWLPQAASGTSISPQLITIAARTAIVSEDFVGSIMKQSGLGAIVVTAVTATGSIDPNGLLYATERIWSLQPDKATGTVSQTFPVVATGAINAAPQVIILGQRAEDRYRTNIGVVNLDPQNERTFDILPSTAPLIDPPNSLQTVTVPPFSMQQIGLVHNAPVGPVLQVIVQPRAGIDPHLWVAYGSSVDNVTGDSWSSLAFPLLTP